MLSALIKRLIFKVILKITLSCDIILDWDPTTLQKTSQHVPTSTFSFSLKTMKSLCFIRNNYYGRPLLLLVLRVSYILFYNALNLRLLLLFSHSKAPLEPHVAN